MQGPKETTPPPAQLNAGSASSSSPPVVTAPPSSPTAIATTTTTTIASSYPQAQGTSAAVTTTSASGNYQPLSSSTTISSPAAASSQTSSQNGPAVSREDRQSNPLPPPPSYSAPRHPIFMPYVTQQLPSYSDLVRDDMAGTTRGGHHDEMRVGFAPHSGGYVPVEIPGYISTGDNTYPLQTRVTRVRVQRAPERAASVSAESSPDDQIKGTYVLVICCILYLNLPAVLMALSALGCLIKARELNSNRDRAGAKKYTKVALACNATAIIGHFVLLSIAFIVLAAIFISDFSLVFTP